MGTEATEVNVANMALSYLGAKNITALNDGSTEADLCTLFIDRSRDLVLEQREWTFAVEHVILDTPVAPAPTNPDWGVGFNMNTVGNCLRVLTVHPPTDVASDFLTDAVLQSSQIPWAMEENIILCNYDEISVRYIKRVTDFTQFSEGFVFALAHRLAYDLAVPLTQNMQLKEQMFVLYQQSIKEAASAEGMQGRSRRIRHRGLLARR